MNRSRELALRLLERARGDQRMLIRLLDDPAMPSWGLGFHAQQAVEKAIKGVLAANAVEYFFSHDLLALLGALEQAGLQPPPGAERLPDLTPFGAALRYDDEFGAGSDAALPDCQWLRNCVKTTLEWAESAVGGGGAP